MRIGGQNLGDPQIVEPRGAGGDATPIASRAQIVRVPVGPELNTIRTYVQSCVPISAGVRCHVPHSGNLRPRRSTPLCARHPVF